VIVTSKSDRRRRCQQYRTGEPASCVHAPDGGVEERPAAEQEHHLPAPIKKLTGHETAATGLGWTEKPRSRFILQGRPHSGAQLIR